MENFDQHDVIGISGKCLLRAWSAGVLPDLMAKGYTLRQAQKLALRHIQYENENHNIIVTAGKSFICGMLIGTYTLGLTYHAVGTNTATPNLADTTLGTEYVRKAITSRTRAGTVLSLATFYVANTVTVYIQEAGIFGGVYASVSPNSGSMFCHWLQAYDNTVSQNDLTFDYSCTFN